MNITFSKKKFISIENITIILIKFNTIKANCYILCLGINKWCQNMNTKMLSFFEYHNIFDNNNKNCLAFINFKCNIYRDLQFIY